MLINPNLTEQNCWTTYNGASRTKIIDDAKYLENMCENLQCELRHQMAEREKSAENNAILKEQIYEQLKVVKHLQEKAKGCDLLKSKINEASELLAVEKKRYQDAMTLVSEKTKALRCCTEAKDRLEVQLEKLRNTLNMTKARCQTLLEEKYYTQKFTMEQMTEKEENSMITQDEWYHKYETEINKVNAERDKLQQELNFVKQLLDEERNRNGEDSDNSDCEENTAITLLKQHLQECLLENKELRKREVELCEQLEQAKAMCKEVQLKLAETTKVNNTADKQDDPIIENCKVQVQNQQIQAKLKKELFKLQVTLDVTNKQHQECLTQLDILKKENKTFEEIAMKKMAAYEKLIKKLEKEKLDTNLKCNKTDCMKKLALLQENLNEVIKERDSKLNAILHLQKIFQQMQKLAIQSKDDQIQYEKENSELRTAAYEAQQKFTTSSAKQEALLSKTFALQERLMKAERSQSHYLSNLKKVESKLREELVLAKKENNKLIAHQKTILLEKEVAMKENNNIEEQINTVNEELVRKKLELENKEHECEQLRDKINQYQIAITKFISEAQNLEKQQTTLAQRILQIQKDKKILEDEILKQNLSSKEQHEKLQTLISENKVLQNTANMYRKLQKKQDILEQQNNDLVEKCNFLENDITVLKKELKLAEIHALDLEKCNNTSLETIDQLTIDKTVELEKITNSMFKQYQTLCDKNRSINQEITQLRDELGLVKQKLSTETEEKNKLQLIKNEIKKECCNLQEKNKELTQQVTEERQETKKLSAANEELKESQTALNSDINKLICENNRVHGDLNERETKIEQLKYLNNELVMQCSENDLKQKHIQNHIDKMTTEALLNIEANSKLRENNRRIVRHLRKYQETYITMKKKHSLLMNEYLEQKANSEVKDEQCIGLKLENEGLNEENTSLRQCIRHERHLAKQRVQKIRTLIKSPRAQLRLQGRNMLAQIDSLLNNCKKLSHKGPTAIKIIEDCKLIKEQVTENQKTLEKSQQLLILLQSKLFTST